MAYKLENLTGEYQKRDPEKKIPEGQMSAMEMSDRTLELINKNFNPLQNLGFEIGEDGKVPERDGVPRIFMMQPDANGMDRIQTLDQAGIQFGTREFWSQVQQGNVFAYPTGSAEPVQLQAEIVKERMPKTRASAPVDMEQVHAPHKGHEYREPNAFTRFMNRIFSGWRKEDCEIYRERQKFANMAEKREKGMDREKEELKAAEKVAAAKAEKAAQKKAYENIQKTADYKKNGKEFYKDLVAPQPKYHPEHSRTEGNEKGFYSREEFDNLKPLDKKVEDYSVGGKQLSMDEYCGLVMACSHDTKFVDEGFKVDSNYDETLVSTMVNNGYSEKDAKQTIINSYSTMISDDLMKGDLRANQGVQIKPTVNPARSMAFEILDEYKQGNKDRLAEKIAESVNHAASSTDQYTHVPHNGAFNHFEFTAAMADLMERDPALKDLAMKKGLKQENLDAVNGMREFSKLDSARSEAKAAIAKANYEGKELSYQDKMKYSKAIISANIMESKLTGENDEHSLNGREIDNVTTRMKKEAEKNGLTVTEAMKNEWKKNPGTRPLPPKGQYYTDQIITVMGGSDEKYNKHPDTVFEFNDPEAMKDCREISEEIVNSNGLADMSVKDLDKALNGPGNMFQGFKLVEQADKAAEKITEQRQREELGIAGKVLDEKGKVVDAPEDPGREKLNTGMNLGHGPVA